MAKAHEKFRSRTDRATSKRHQMNTDFSSEINEVSHESAQALLRSQAVVVMAPRCT